MQKRKYNKDLNVRNIHKGQLAHTITAAEGSWGSSGYSRVEVRTRATVCCTVARAVTLKHLTQSASLILLHIFGQDLHRSINNFDKLNLFLFS
jgi:hypothetical protein